MGAMGLVIASADASALVKAQADDVCTGVADEVKIRSAWLATGIGEQLFLVGPTFTLSAELDIEGTRKTLKGVGLPTLDISALTGNTFGIRWDPTSVDVAVKSLRLYDSNGGGGKGASAIQYGLNMKGTRPRASGVHVVGANMLGVAVYGTDSVLERLYVEDGGDDCVSWFLGSSGVLRDSILVNPGATHAISSAIHSCVECEDGASDIRILNNTMKSVASSPRRMGVEIHSHWNGVVQGCKNILAMGNRMVNVDFGCASTFPETRATDYHKGITFAHNVVSGGRFRWAQKALDLHLDDNEGDQDIQPGDLHALSDFAVKGGRYQNYVVPAMRE